MCLKQVRGASKFFILLWKILHKNQNIKVLKPDKSGIFKPNIHTKDTS